MEQKLSPRELCELKEFFETTLDLWHVPGLAIAVIKDGQVILCEGYGLRQIDTAAPVTSETLFPIASCTKAFTSLALGLLVEAGTLDWDTSLKHYLPTFKMWDSFATERLTPRDLLTHRSGLPGHDMLWYASTFDRREIFERLRYLEPSCDLRSSFQYQNLMYAVAGILVEEITGRSWEDFVQTQIFDRLGMHHSNFSTAAIQQSSDFASPHFYHEGQLEVMPFPQEDAARQGMVPAGGICSCASDMAKWLQVHLNHGKIGDQILISEGTLEQMHAPQIFVDDEVGRNKYGYEFTSYGLGWGMRAHKGQFLVEHDGMTDGFYSLVSFMPRHNMGVVALSNCDAYYSLVQNNLAPNIITYTLYDRLLGLESTDWNASMKMVCEERAAVVRQFLDAQSAAKPTVEAPASHPIHSYVGNYEHPGYGMVSIRKIGEKLQMVINEKLTLPIEHCYYDVFEVIFEMTGQRQKFSFLTDLEGNISQVACQLEPKVKEIIFTRVEPN
jgi:CubicO group peptidase (beta-lactamase class C family)